MTPEPISQLKKEYEDIPELVNADDAEKMAERFYRNFTDIAVSAREDDPMHLFFIGLAFLNGIEVEVDYSRAVTLLTRAADQNYAPAVEQLAHMYQFGKGVVRNTEKTLALYEKLILLISDQEDQQKLLDVHCEVLRLLLDSGWLFRYEHMESVKSHTLSTAELLSKVKLSNFEYFKIFSLLTFVNEHDDAVADMFKTEALRLLPGICEDGDHILTEEAFFYSQLAALYYRCSAGLLVYHFSSDPVHKTNVKQGEQYIRKAVDLHQKLYENNPLLWKEYYADTLSVFCQMNFSQQFCSLFPGSHQRRSLQNGKQVRMRGIRL